MISHFSVKNYKCLADVSIPLTPVHVLIGQNDSGKTSLLEAMLALSNSTRMPLAQAFVGDWEGRELVFEGATRPVVDFEVGLEGQIVSEGPGLPYHLAVEFQSERNFCGRIEEWSTEGNRFIDPQFGSASTAVSNRQHLPAGAHRDHLNLIADRLGRAHYYRLDPRSMAVPAAFDESRKFRLDADGFGLATLLDDILGDDPEQFLQLRAAFCRYYPQFRSVRLETLQASTRQYHDRGRSSTSIALGKGIFLETVQGTSIRAGQASDGAMLFLAFLALIYSPRRPQLLLIEEPEKGVYPKRLLEVIELLRRLRDDAKGLSVPQIIMTTHSPYLLSSFEPEEVTFLLRDGETGAARAYPLRDAPHIHDRLGNGDFYLGELWYNLSEDELLNPADR